MKTRITKPALLSLILLSGGAFGQSPSQPSTKPGQYFAGKGVLATGQPLQ